MFQFTAPTMDTRQSKCCLFGGAPVAQASVPRRPMAARYPTIELRTSDRVVMCRVNCGSANANPDNQPDGFADSSFAPSLFANDCLLERQLKLHFERRYEEYANDESPVIGMATKFRAL